jgi:hypothetical protein
LRSSVSDRKSPKYRCNSWVLWSSVRGVLAPDPHHVSVPIDSNISNKSVPIMGAGV